jgi:hypothetical protein
MRQPSLRPPPPPPDTHTPARTPCRRWCGWPRTCSSSAGAAWGRAWPRPGTPPGCHPAAGTDGDGVVLERQQHRCSAAGQITAPVAHRARPSPHCGDGCCSHLGLGAHGSPAHARAHPTGALLCGRGECAIAGRERAACGASGHLHRPCAPAGARAHHGLHSVRRGDVGECWMRPGTDQYACRRNWRNAAPNPLAHSGVCSQSLLSPAWPRRARRCWQRSGYGWRMRWPL